MKEIAFFCSVYPGYTVEKCLAMLAITFFAFLDEAYRLHARQMIENITAIAVGFNGGDEAEKILETYMNIGYPDRFDPEDYSGITQLKGNL